ncbi:MAG TPA: hypothetical protein PLK94_07875 [Alphaproteobacteria bacterium]|nr:hypothetical protein [Alphaproteobacteria bacterium]
MVNFDDSKYNFNSTDYSYLLLKNDEDIPSAVATTSPLNYTPPNTQHSAIKSYTLISPYTLSAVALVEGTMSVNIKVGVQAPGSGTSSATITCTQIDMRVYLIDGDANETDILDETIWTGSISGTIPSGTDSLGVMYWADVAGIGIDYDHRLACDIDLYYNISYTIGGSADWSLRLYCDPTVPDTAIKLPFVIGG